MPASHTSGTYAQRPTQRRPLAPNRSQGAGTVTRRRGNTHGPGVVVGGARPFLPPGVRPAPTPAPAAAPAAPATPPDPRDSDYYAGIADLVGNRHDFYAGLARAETTSKQDRDDALRQLVKARADSLLNAKNAANSRGLFYSSYLTNQNADIGTDYDDRETGARNAYERGHAEREGQRATAERLYGRDGDITNYGSEGARLLREAVARALGAQVDAPATDAAALAAPQATAQTVDTSAHPAEDTSRGGWGPGGPSQRDLLIQAMRGRKAGRHTGVL